MSVRALKVYAPGLARGVDIPAAAPLVCDERAAVCVGDGGDEACVVCDAVQSVVEGEGAAFEGCAEGGVGGR